MKISERKLKALSRSRDVIERFATDRAAWKPRIADAVLALVRDGRPITVDSLKEQLTAMGKGPLVIEGTELEIPVSRIASETAIAHLEKAVAADGED